jgi:hypothetical protein
MWYKVHLVGMLAKYHRRICGYHTIPSRLRRDAMSKKNSLTGKHIFHSRPELLILAHVETLVAESRVTKRFTPTHFDASVPTY